VRKKAHIAKSSAKNKSKLSDIQASLGTNKQVPGSSWTIVQYALRVHQITGVFYWKMENIKILAMIQRNVSARLMLGIRTTDQEQFRLLEKAFAGLSNSPKVMCII